jgi:two-component system OmpR family response regulator
MRILVVEDTVALAEQLRVAIFAAGHAVDLAYDGDQALHLGETEPYDAVVLDIGLPKLDGLSVLRRWRQLGQMMPVLILTARGTWTEKVDGLNAGADDYLAKPFEIAELLARLNALIRRAHGHAAPVMGSARLRIDTIRKEVTLDGTAIRLTGLEYELLAVLAHHAGAPVTKAHLTEHLYSQDFDRDSNTLEVIVSRLRRKLGEGVIETQRGRGYRLMTPEQVHGATSNAIGGA